MRIYAIAILSVALSVGCSIPPRPTETLQPGQVVRITFTGIPQPETHTLTIDQTGKIVLPYIGEVSAAGKTPPELENEITKAFLRPAGWVKSFEVSVSQVDK